MCEKNIARYLTYDIFHSTHTEKIPQRDTDVRKNEGGNVINRVAWKQEMLRRDNCVHTILLA